MSVLKAIGALIAALVVWFVVATIIDRSVRVAWPAYALTERLLVFTLPMKIYRLVLGAVCTVVAALAARRMNAARWLPLAFGFALILLFLPEHIRIWSRLPAWYHVTFLGYLIPLAVLGARLRSARPSQVPAK